MVSSPLANPPDARPPAARGFGWLAEGLALLRAQPARLILAALLLQLILGLSRLPIIGVLVVLAVPALVAGLLEILHRVASGGSADLRLLLTPLATAGRVGRLLAMGAVVFAIGMVCISVLLSGSSELTDPELMQRIEQGDVEAITTLSQESLGRIVLAFLVSVAVSGTVSYFAIPLLWFGDRRLGGALFEGLRALVVNWRPLGVLGIGLGLLFLPVAVVSGLLFGAAMQGGPVSVLIMGLIMILLLGFQLLLFATQYCAYRELFGLPGRAVPAEAGDGGAAGAGRDDQFVA